MLGSNFALLVRSPGDDGQQLLTTGSRLVCISLGASDNHQLLELQHRAFVNTRLLVHKHVKISVDEWI